MDTLFDFYSLIWVLSIALAPVLLSAVAALVIWNVRDVEGHKRPWVSETTTNGADVGGYTVVCKGGRGVVELRWRDDLPGLGRCRLEVTSTAGGNLAFCTRVPAFDMHFAVRAAGKDAVANLWANGHRLEPAVRFLEQRLGKVENVRVKDGTILFYAKRGSVSAKLLPEMVQFANAFYDAAAFPPLAPRPPELRSSGDYRRPPEVGGQAWRVERLGGSPMGPIASEQIVRGLYAGEVGPTTRIAAAESGPWKPIGNVSPFRELFRQPAPPPEPACKAASAARQRFFWRLRKPYGDIALTIGSLVALMGSVLLASGKATWDRAIESVAWPAVPGRVVESRRACSASGSGSTRSTSCSHVLRYEYEVQGKRYEQGRRSFGSDDDTIEARVQRYPAGKAVQVYYRPLDPGDAVLETGPQHLQPLIYAYPPLLLGLGLTMPLGAWKLSLLLGRLRRGLARRRIRRAVGEG